MGPIVPPPPVARLCEPSRGWHRLTAFQGWVKEPLQMLLIPL